MTRPSDYIAQKIPMPSGMSAADWELIAPKIRERAFFSARVEEERIINELKRQVLALVKGEISPSEFRRDMRSYLARIGYDPGDDAGTVKDLYTQKRLDLILETNRRMARGCFQRMQTTTEDALAEFPADRLVRAYHRNFPRDWDTRWNEAAQLVNYEGVYRGNDKIALKSSPIWSAISRFGLPYPPFDYNSGMSVLGVSIDECLAIGLVKPDDPPQVIPPPNL